MPRLDRGLVKHKLPIKEGYLPVKQARRWMSMETELKVKEEIERLVKAGFIRPAIFVDWLSNIALDLKRKTGAVRVYVDYRNLNKASPKYEYLMPMTAMLVDIVAHNQMLSFMGGNAGYNQIMVANEDIHKSVFMCPGHIGAFEYVVMPFDLKNARATYQRAMNSIFHDMAGHSLEVYIDDVVIKSPEKGNHVSNLKKAFLRMRQHKLKMNPMKCVFRVQAGNFLGFLVPQRGIEIDKNKAKSIIEALSPRNKKELQSLLGKINFFRRWEEQHHQAFEEIKYYLSNSPVLPLPKRGRPLKLLCLALYFTAIKLRHYMLPFTIYIIANTNLIKYMLTRPMLKAELVNGPQKATKGQAVADFLVDHPREEIENVNSMDIANTDRLSRAHICLNNPIY
ncbi:unnamed protein product [Prunus armeniaca]